MSERLISLPLWRGLSRLGGRDSSRRSYCLTSVVVALVLPVFLAAQAPKPGEYDVKAAYLANFGKFVEWPSKPARGEPFNVCVLGEDPFGSSLEAAFEGETVDKSPLAIKRIQKPGDAAACRILFISSSESNQLKAVLAATKTGVLTVGESPDFTKQGGVIQFVLDRNKVRFEINLAAAQRAGLNPSSELLKLATTVRRSP